MKVQIAVLMTAVALLVPVARAHEPAQDSPAIKEVNAAFSASHNLDHELALSHARKAVALDPNSSRVHRGLASIIWLQQVFERGTMTVDHFLGSVSTSKLPQPKVDPKLSEEFKGALAKAIELAERRLRQEPRNLDALFDAGAAYSIQASHMASVEGGLGGALKAARRAFDTQNEVLTRDPSRASAGFVVGMYRYVISTQPRLVQMFAWLAGFPGDKQKAIEFIEAASHDPLSRVEGKSALIVIYSREGRHSEAMRLAGELSVELPRNRLLLLEEGAAAIRAGRAGDANAVLTRGLAAFETDTRPKIRSEHALWLYKRGLARLNLNRPAEAKIDLDRALTVQPLPWVEGRIHVALGKLADLAGRRPDAMAAYTTARTKCTEAADKSCLDEAPQYLKQPFSFDHRRP